AALLLLMLEAANARPRFTISLKRSTQNLQLSTSSPADYPIYRGQNGQQMLRASFSAFDPKADFASSNPRMSFYLAWHAVQFGNAKFESACRS
ncbi:MAG: hypothetical protein WBL84_01620, partial [Xanthobacteraceae bacterium]